jgi:hypothetical protein
MTVKKLEISNLGLKAHQVHAENEQKTEPQYLAKYLPFLFAPAEILGTSDIFISQLEQLFEVVRFTPWAAFLPPRNYERKSRNIFGFKIFPNLNFNENAILDLGDGADREKLSDFFSVVNDLDAMAEIVNNNKQRFHKG